MQNFPAKMFRVESTLRETVIGTSALLGNFGVISYRCVRERELIRTPYGYFIINLGISDLLMGIYLYMKGD
jgi:hypothetical protein